LKYAFKIILAGNSKEIIVQAIKTDDLVKFTKELDILLAVKTVTELIDITLDENGNNLWTLAAENGTEEVMNFLLDMISSWPRKDLDRVLHFWTRHREHFCMAILETSKTIILDYNYEDLKFINLKNHLNINSSKPSELRDYLKTTKKHLDTTIDSLDNSIRKMKRWDSEKKIPNQLRRTLVDLRTGLLLKDLEWHHNSLTGIVSQSYPPDSMTVQRVTQLEFNCHNQCQPEAIWNENHIEICGKETFLNCICKRVGKSPCTLEALKMASQTATLLSKWNFISSIFFRMKKRYPFLICFNLFIFSFGLLVLDIFTDVKLVLELYQLKNLPDFKNRYRYGDFDLTNYLRHYNSKNNFIKVVQSAKDRRNVDLPLTLFWLTFLAVILPTAGYCVSWLTADNELGFCSMKKKVC
jgi:hypothetical protein